MEITREVNRYIVFSMSRDIESKYNKLLANENFDMWLVYVIRWSKFDNEYVCDYAYIHNRFDAEKWFSEKTKDIPYYGYCCTEKSWHNIDELL